MNDLTNLPLPTPNPKTINELFPSKWLRADDLKGRSFELIVERVTIEELNGMQGKHLSCVLWFKSAKKGLVLNKTQCLAMATITGTEIFEKWVGATVLIRPGTAHNRKPTVIIDKPTKKGM